MLLTHFFVIACGQSGDGGNADKGNGIKLSSIAMPAAPSGVAAISGNDRITVKWTPTQGALSYAIYCSDKPGKARTYGEKIARISGSSFEHIGVKQMKMYYYVVTASNEIGESPPSAESGAMVQTVALQAPSSVAATGGDGRITVKWNKIPGASSYNIYYATNPGIARAKGTKIEGVKSGPYQLADVKKKTMYFISMTAVNASGESPASNETGAMP